MLKPLDDAMLARIREQIERNDPYHKCNLELMLKYFLYFTPSDHGATSDNIHSVLHSMGTAHDKLSIQLNMDGLTAAKSASVLRDEVRYRGSAFTTAYRFERTARRRFEQECQSLGAIVLDDSSPEPETKQVSSSLKSLIATIESPSEREFGEETLRCLEAGAYRAAIVMGWVLAYEHLRRWLLRAPQVTAFNIALTSRPKNKKANLLHDPVKTLDDFSDHRERFIVDLCKDAGLLSDPEFRALVHGLDNRNAHAHPSGTAVSASIAAGHVDRLIREIVANPKFQ